MRAVIILGNIENINNNILKDSYIIGVDKGAYLAYKKRIRLDIAIGDFDSINEVEYNNLCSYTKIIKLNSIKDSTDTNEAIKLCKNYDEIIILGGITGKRIEHFYANYLELVNNKKLSMMDDNSYIITSSNDVIPNNNYKYVSIFSITPYSIITLTGFKYNLNNYKLTNTDPLCISNEIINNPIIKIHSGRVLIIYSKSDNE